MTNWYIHFVRVPAVNNLAGYRALNANITMQDKGIYSWTNMIKYILDTSSHSHIWTSKRYNLLSISSQQLEDPFTSL